MSNRITSIALGLAMAVLTLIPAARALRSNTLPAVQQWPTPTCQPNDPNCPQQRKL